MTHLPVWADIHRQIDVVCQEGLGHATDVLGTDAGKRPRPTGHVTLDLSKDADNEEPIDWSQYAKLVADSDFLQELITISQNTPAGRADVHRDGTVAVTREYEETFLCAPTGAERPCCMADGCEGLKLVDCGVGGFVLREFLLPGHDPPAEPNMCLLCTRKAIAKAYIALQSTDLSVRPSCLLARYYNLVNVPGEYCADDCLVTDDSKFLGLVDPVVFYRRTDYRGRIRDGVRCLEQFNLRRPTSTDPQPFLTSGPAPNSQSGPTPCADPSSTQKDSPTSCTRSPS